MLASVKKKYGRYLQNAGKIVVAISGGADSLALLHVMRQIVGSHNLVVAHVDHGWREASRDDALFVRQTAVSWGISYHGQRLSKNEKETALEAIGREARHHFFEQVARSEEANCVAVGHNQNDQSETILMHLIRGSGLAGLQGMGFDTIQTGQSQLRIIRPLLQVSRAEIELYCQENQIIPRQDATNEDATFLRNRIRHQLMPELVTYNAQFEQHLLQLAEIASADYGLLKQVAQTSWEKVVKSRGERWLSIDRQMWLDLPLALKRLHLRRVLTQLNPQLTEIGFQTIEDARLGLENGHFGNQYHLPSSISALIQQSTILFMLPHVNLPVNFPLLNDNESQMIVVPTKISLKSGWNFAAQWIEDPDFDLIFNNQNRWVAFVSPSEGKFELRTRKAGEKIRPLGMNGRSRKLKKVMSENHIPRPIRDRWPIVTCGDEIVWLSGIMNSDQNRVQGNETRIIQLSFT